MGISELGVENQNYNSHSLFLGVPGCSSWGVRRSFWTCCSPLAAFAASGSGSPGVCDAGAAGSLGRLHRREHQGRGTERALVPLARERDHAPPPEAGPGALGGLEEGQLLLGVPEYGQHWPRQVGGRDLLGPAISWLSP